MHSVIKVSVLAAAISVVGCAPDDPYQRTKTGAAVGAIAGAVIGHQLDSNAGRFVGGAVGAALGGGIGYAMDRQHQQLQALAAENQRLGITVQRLQDGSIKLNLPSGVTFAVDSDQVRGEFRSILARVAGILNEDPRTRVTVVGHTDNTGDANYNLDLSRRRADSVATILESNGVAYGRLFIDGRGEAEPIASNSTASGRQANRRVEIFVSPPSS